MSGNGEGWWRRAVMSLERFLGWWGLSLAAFAILSHKLILAAGFQFDEWILAMILYINFSTKVEQIHALATSTGKDGGSKP